MEEYTPEKQAADRQEYGHEIFLHDVKNKIAAHDYKEALRLAALKYNELKKMIEAESEVMTARELAALTDEFDDLRSLYDPLMRLSEIATRLASDTEMGSQTTVDLTDEARQIRDQLELLVTHD